MSIYSQAVLADAPLVYATLDEISGTVANLGSAGGTMNVGTNVTRNQTPAGQIGGASFSFANDQNSNVNKTAQPISSTNWTFDTWYKNNTSYGASFDRNIFVGYVSGTNFLKVAVGQGGYISVQEPAGNNGVTHATVQDGNWHHIAVTRTSAAIRVYVDGALVGSSFNITAPAARTSATITFGNNLAGQYAMCYLDEPAFYNASSLTATRITAHYQAGLAAPTTTVQAPAMTLSLSVPVPVVNPLRLHVPAMSLSIDTGQDINLTTQRRLTATGDWNAFLDSGTSAVLHYTQPLFIRFAALGYALNEKQIPDAKLHLRTWSAIKVTSFKLARITSDWSATSGPAPTYEVLPTVYTVTSTGQDFNIDVKSIVQAWNNGTANYGIALIPNTWLPNPGGDPNNHLTDFYGSAYSNTEFRPYIAAEIIDAVPTPVTVTAPAAELTLSAVPPVRVKLGWKVSAPAAAELSLSTVAPVVIPGKRLTVHVPAATLSLTFPGGFAKHHLSKATVAEAWLTPVDPYSGIRYPKTVNAPAIALTLAGVAPGVSLMTHKLSKTTPISLSLRVPGIYSRQADRYRSLLVSKLDADDIWYDLEDIPGSTRAKDWSLTGQGQGAVNQSGYYFGPSPEFRVDGPQLRKATHFNGENYLLVGPYMGDTYGKQGLQGLQDVVIEFSIKTTTQNGVIFNATGGQALGSYSSMNQFGFAKMNGNKLVIENGKLVLIAKDTIPGGGWTLRTGSTIADGEWHHIVINVPYFYGTNSFAENSKPNAFIVLDGQPVMVRGTFGPALSWLPHSFMADVDEKTVAFVPVYNTPKNAIVGTLSDLSVRIYDKMVSVAEAQKHYYEWSDSRVLEVPPITVSLRTVAPARAKGNQKKMLLLYGLGMSYTYNFGSPGYVHSLWNYFSNAAGFPILNYGGSYYGENGRLTTDIFWEGVNAHPARSGGSAKYFEPISFDLGEYKVYPVSIYSEGHLTNVNDNTSLMGAYDLPTSLPGTIDKSQFDDGEGGLFMDNATGKPRFIDLQKDLTNDVAQEYDVISVVNYPWHEFDQNPSDNYDSVTRSMTGYGDFDWKMENAGTYASYMTQTEYATMRDKFRDSIMNAAHSGVSLWIPEIHAAEHLGFIQGYNLTKPGFWEASYALPIWANGTIVNLGGMNKRAAQLDREHGMATAADTLGVTGDYYSYMQTNRFRRIVATESGLTDGETFDYAEGIDYYKYDDWAAGQGAAFDVAFFANGYQPGSLSFMSMYPWAPGAGSYAAFHSNSHEQREFIMSAFPQGIAGKVIARQQEFWYGPNGVRYDNPYKDNVITIAAERGTIVRGKPIRGRAFLEFMDANTLLGNLTINDPNYVGDGSTALNSTWDYDERRQRTVTQSTPDYNILIGAGVPGAPGRTLKKTISMQYQVVSDGRFVDVPYRSMNRRGLDWIAKVDNIDPNDARTFAGPMELTLRTPNAKARQDRTITNKVIGAMRLDISVNDARNYQGKDRSVRAFPMTLDLQVRGTGKSIKVAGAMTLGLQPMPVLATGFGDRVTVYWDGDTNVTLFLKEDN